MARVSFVLALVLAVLPSLVARADDGWSKAFPSDAVGSYFDGKPAVIVIGAGAAASGVAPAARAFEASLRLSGGASLVMNGEGLGDLSGLDDPAIVSRTSALPVALVAVVRVFPNGRQPASAVVTVYDKSGKLAFAVSAGEGTPLAPELSGVGVSTAAAKSVAEATLTVTSGERKKAQDEYDEKFVSFEDYEAIGMNQYGAVVSANQLTQAYQGKYKKPLVGAAFYEAVGHPEMAAHYRDVEAHNTTWAWVSGGIAAATFAVGTVMWVSAVQVKGDEPINDGAILGGVLISTLGPLVVGGGVCLATHQNPDSVDAPGARKLADEYDSKLKHDLGLDESSDAGGSGGRLRFGIAPTSGGGVVGVAGAF